MLGTKEVHAIDINAYEGASRQLHDSIALAFVREWL